MIWVLKNLYKLLYLVREYCKLAGHNIQKLKYFKINCSLIKQSENVT